MRSFASRSASVSARTTSSSAAWARRKGISWAIGVPFSMSIDATISLMNAIANERTKFLASVLQTTATSCFTVGTATPLAGYLYDIGNLRSTLDNWALAVGLACWLSAAAALHLVARYVLKRLRP
jgi:hypothetical protein